ncbi:hypothetical protein ACPCHT_22640 [Nucisporomicrobium flavum]|jgi:hypothetical protein|uniref:hypothetical protein n=1 Tax=Nucisporomicrobium flavum TaxID=2785915 RepID=UPI0018F3CA18|nr:hypothetical protein [Nucisporomicrobium flavum]
MSTAAAISDGPKGTDALLSLAHATVSCAGVVGRPGPALDVHRRAVIGLEEVRKLVSTLRY